MLEVQLPTLAIRGPNTLILYSTLRSYLNTKTLHYKHDKNHWHQT